MAIPSDIANLVQWLKSDTGLYQDAAKATACTNGTTVYTWANQGSGGYDFIQATAGNRPTLDTTTPFYPQVVFSSGKRLAATHANIAQPYTIVFVGRRALSANYSVFISDPAIAVQATFPPNVDYMYLYAGYYNTYTSSSVPSLFPRSPTQFCAVMRYQYASSIVRYNRKSILTFTPGADDPGSGGLANTNLMSDSAGSYPTVGAMSEYMLYSRAISDSEIGQIEDYVIKRYNLERRRVCEF